MAEQMHTHGFPAWTQVIVSKTEKGNRPLLFAEAIALAAVLRVKLPDLAG